MYVIGFTMKKMFRSQILATIKFSIVRVNSVDNSNSNSSTKEMTAISIPWNVTFSILNPWNVN